MALLASLATATAIKRVPPLTRLTALERHVANFVQGFLKAVEFILFQFAAAVAHGFENSGDVADRGEAFAASAQDGFGEFARRLAGAT